MVFFSTRRKRERLKQEELIMQRLAANIAAFETGQLAKQAAYEAGVRSPAELAEVESRSSTQRQKSTPAV